MRKEKDKARMVKWRAIEEGTGCWVWTGSKTHNGYGKMEVQCDGKPKKVLVHRYALELFSCVELGKADIVHHTCRNRACFNPDHLEICTQSYNMFQKWEDWRQFCDEHQELISELDNIKRKVSETYVAWRKGGN